MQLCHFFNKFSKLWFVSIHAHDLFYGGSRPEWIGMYGLLRWWQVFLNLPANVEAAFWIRQTGTSFQFPRYCGTCCIPSISSAEFAANNIFPFVISIATPQWRMVILVKTGFQTFHWFIDIRIFLSTTVWKGYLMKHPPKGYAFSRFLSQSQEEHTF